MREAVERQIAEGATEDEAAAIDPRSTGGSRATRARLEMAVRRTYPELAPGLD